MIEVNLWALFVVALVAGVGAYFGTYLREKAKNRAIHEDIDRMVKATEDIKAEVSGNLWLRQRRWELERELYSHLLENLNEIRAVLKTYQDEENPARRARYGERIVDSIEETRRARAIGAALLRREAVEALGRLDVDWRAMRELDGDPEERLAARIKIVDAAYTSLIAAAREDLLGGTR
jgi:hypothetical protein